MLLIPACLLDYLFSCLVCGVLQISAGFCVGQLMKVLKTQFISTVSVFIYCLCGHKEKFSNSSRLFVYEPHGMTTKAAAYVCRLPKNSFERILSRALMAFPRRAGVFSLLMVFPAHSLCGHSSCGWQGDGEHEVVMMSICQKQKSSQTFQPNSR